MEDSILELKDTNGKKVSFRILLNVKDKDNKKNFIIYTDDKEDKNGNKKVFASSYIISDKGNITKFKDIEEKDYDFVNNLISSLEE